jgi:hypothetical protein
MNAITYPSWAAVLFKDGTFSRRLIFRHALTGRLYVYRLTGLLSTRVYVKPGESVEYVEG